ncbi:MAG: abortive infection family protein [Pseudonocardiaceae bacterium]
MATPTAWTIAVETIELSVVRASGANRTSLVKVMPLSQTWMVTCGVIEKLSCPVSLLAITKPAKTSGLSAPRSPENSVGDGHGAADLPVGLDLRHGRLAVRSAIAWCGFMLDTLHDQKTCVGDE